MSEYLAAVCSDIDGTQIISGQKIPSIPVQEAAQKLRSHDIPLIEVSARGYDMLRDFLNPEEGLDLLALGSNYCVLEGGASVIRADTGEVEWSERLSRATTLEIVRSIGDLSTSMHDDKQTKKLQLQPRELLEAMERGEMLADGAPSMFVIFPRINTDIMRSTLRAIEGIRQPRFMHYDEDLTQLCLQIGGGKDTGTRQGLSLSGLEGKSVLKIGDGAADIDLFNSAPGPNVALRGGDPELLAMADWIAPSVEEHGFAAAIDHFGPQLFRAA